MFVLCKQLLEMLSEDYGGRVELAKAYFKALTDSVKKHFKGNGVIASMEHCNDFMLLGTEAIALGRVGTSQKNQLCKKKSTFTFHFSEVIICNLFKQAMIFGLMV